MIPPKVDVHSLMVFYFVAVEGSVTAAAEKLFLTQPTVSYHIKTLENSIGIKLLEIKRQKVTLTPAGTGVFQYAKDIYQNVTDAEMYLLSLKESSLRVGVTMVFSEVVANAAAAFLTLYPQVKLIVRDGVSCEVAADVLNSKIDVGIVISASHDNSKLKITGISPAERLVLVASRANSITKKDKIELADLYNAPLVAGPTNSALRNLILKKFQEEGLETPPIMAEVNTLQFGMRLVDSGKCVGIYPERVVEKKIAEGHLKSLPLANELSVGVEALERLDRPGHPFVEEFINSVKASFTPNN